MIIFKDPNNSPLFAFLVTFCFFTSLICFAFSCYQHKLFGAIWDYSLCIFGLHLMMQSNVLKEIFNILLFGKDKEDEI